MVDTCIHCEKQTHRFVELPDGSRFAVCRSCWEEKMRDGMDEALDDLRLLDAQIKSHGKINTYRE